MSEGDLGEGIWKESPEANSLYQFSELIEVGQIAWVNLSQLFWASYSGSMVGQKCLAPLGANK